MDTQTITWLVSAPQFWYGFVACAALLLLALLPRVLFAGRTVIIYRPHDRAPIPCSDPFYKPGADTLRPSRTGTALRKHREKLKQTRPSFDTRLSPRSLRIGEARKQTVWHPHPDDSLLSLDTW